MSMWSRLKSLAGGSGRTDTDKTITVAATTWVPDEGNFFLLSGTATITSLNAATATRDRRVVFVGSSGTQTFTNTNGTTTAGQMDLGGASIALGPDDVLELVLRQNGVWNVANYRRNNNESISLAAAATTVVPDTSDFFSLTGTATITTLTGTTTGRPRIVTFYGAASSAVTFTHTAAPATGQMFLGGANRLVSESIVLQLMLDTDGTWTIVNYTG